MRDAAREMAPDDATAMVTLFNHLMEDFFGLPARDYCEVRPQILSTCSVGVAMVQTPCSESRTGQMTTLVCACSFAQPTPETSPETDAPLEARGTSPKHMRIAALMRSAKAGTDGAETDGATDKVRTPSPWTVRELTASVTPRVGSACIAATGYCF